MTKELTSQGLQSKVAIVPAVTESRNPVVNISKAHKKCVRAAMEAGEERVIIMEDDVKFLCPRSFSRFLELSEGLPNDWDLFLAGAYDAKFEASPTELTRITKFSGLHCYMVSKRYYENFLKANEIINLDKWMSTPGYSSSNAYVALPMLAMQHDGFSDNVRRETKYNEHVVRKYPMWDCSKEAKV